jgi:hypothetical protein
MAQSGCEVTLNITWNIVGGFIVAWLTFIYQWITKRLKHRKFRKIFGNDLDNFHLVYASYNSPKGIAYSKPLPKVPRPSNLTVNLTTINSTAITRCISHLSYAIGNSTDIIPHIASDIEIDQQMDISFLSLGGVNNYKSLDVLDDNSNVFIQFGPNGIHSKTSGKPIVNIHGNFDYGLILKLHPECNRKRTWLCAAGLGEWGTSGAAYWLSFHWRELFKLSKGNPFACITKTKYGSDDSTSLVHFFRSKEDVEKVAI